MPQGEEMDPHMFDGLFEMVITLSAAAGAAVVGVIWLAVHFVVPHIHLAWH
jgi:hypothetical protein